SFSLVFRRRRWLALRVRRQPGSRHHSFTSARATFHHSLRHLSALARLAGSRLAQAEKFGKGMDQLVHLRPGIIALHRNTRDAAVLPFEDRDFDAVALEKPLMDF